MNGVVPLAVEGMRRKMHARELRVRDALNRTGFVGGLSNERIGDGIFIDTTISLRCQFIDQFRLCADASQLAWSYRRPR